MMKSAFSPIVSSLFFSSLLLQCTVLLAQSPAQAPTAPVVANAPLSQPQVPVTVADGPAPPGPPNVTRILTKAGGFNTLIRLLRSTQVADQITQQLNDSSQSLTIFAPTDSAFSGLKAGTLNSLSDQEKVELLKFHILPVSLSIKNFQTLTNPVVTQAGGNYEFPLNVTTDGSAVNISTGLVNTSVSGTVYKNNQLAIYRVDSVLKPLGIFSPRSPPPAPAPAPEKPKKKEEPIAETPKVVTPPVEISRAISLAKNWLVSIGVAFLAAMFLGGN